MSVVKSIYKAPIVANLIDSNLGCCSIGIMYNGHLFYGDAKLSKEDKDFFSEKVGKSIATSKARIKILKYELEASKRELFYRNNFYQEALSYGQRSPAEVDPTGRFYHGISRCIIRVEQIKNALKKE